MNRLFAMFRYSKKLLIISILLMFDLFLTIGLVAFDVIQLILITKNHAMLSVLFLPLNIILIILASINLILVVAFVIIKKLKEKSNEFEKN